jgi:hypothetical protein
LYNAQNMNGSAIGDWSRDFEEPIELPGGRKL